MNHLLNAPRIEAPACTDCDGHGGYDVTPDQFTSPDNARWQNCTTCDGTGEAPTVSL